MDSLKFLFGVVLFLLCMLVAGIVIWVMLFGIPKSAMDGGTLVNLFGQMNWRRKGRMAAGAVWMSAHKMEAKETKAISRCI